MKIEFIGLTQNAFDKKHLMFEYRVTIGKETTSYYTGIGHIEKVSSNILHGVYKDKPGLKVFTVPSKYKLEFLSALYPLKRSFTLYESERADTVYRREPKPSDIAECLLSDIQLGSESFDEFCFSLGYSNDSLKAFDTYRACMETARKFKKSDLVQYLTEEQKLDGIGA